MDSLIEKEKLDNLKTIEQQKKKKNEKNAKIREQW
jgi:hypothetical protein